MGRFWALLGFQGAHESTGATPRPPRSPPEAPGAFPDNLGFWPPGGSPSTAPKPIKAAVPRLRHLSRSIRTTFLLQVGGLNPSESLLGLHFMTFLAPGCFRNCGQGSEKEGWGLRKRAGVGDGGQGSEMGPWDPKLEVSARAFLAGAFFSVKNRALGPKVGVLGLGRSSQGRFFPSKKGPRGRRRRAGVGDGALGPKA